MQRVLLEERGRAAASDSKTVRAVHFDVPPGVEALALKFDYGPRTSTDEATNRARIEECFEIHTRRRRLTLSPSELQRHRSSLGLEERAKCMHNLMNVTLIDSKGAWRGRWDRNPASDDGRLVLSKDHASRGFLAGPIPPGQWTCAVECHGVFGEPVSWELLMEARGGLSGVEVEKLQSQVRSKSEATRRVGPGWYFGEMHSHTVHSDGKWEVEELASRVAANGSDFLCLTDHNTMSGHQRPPAALPLTLIRGTELTTFHGHHPLYGIEEMVPWHSEGRVLPLGEIAPRVRSQGGVVSVAHPFVPGDPLCTGCRMPADLDPASFDMMEIWYRRWGSAGADNVAAYELWNKHWKNGHRIVGVGARDVHGAEQEAPFPGEMPLTGVYASDNTAPAIVEALRAGRVIISGGPIVELRLEAREGAADLGETLSANRADRALVTVRRSEGPAELRLLARGEVVATMPLTADGTYEVPLRDASPGWYRAEVWQGESPRVITNHVVWAAKS